MAQSRTQLRLVDTPAHQPAAHADPTRQVFEHWLLVLGKSPARCKLGPTRRAAINAALTLYDVDTLMLAVEGVACPLEGCSERMRAAMREIEWLFATEARVERFAELGDALRAEDARRQADARAEMANGTASSPDAEQVAAQRARLAALAASLRQAREHG